MEPSDHRVTGEFLPLHLAVMQPGTLAPVDLYLGFDTPRRYTLYRSARTPFTEEARQRLIERGVSLLYVRREDEDAYVGYVVDNLSRILHDELLPPRRACELVVNTSTRVMRAVFDDPRSGRNLDRVKDVVSAAVFSIMRSPDAVWDMASLAAHDYHTYTHSVQVSVFLIATAKELLEVRDSTLLERIGYGGMLHDIGKSRIPEAILHKPEKLTQEEFEQVKAHPLLGLEMIERYRKIPASTAAVVRSHHERFDGRGYPDGLAGRTIRPVARLAKITDVYDALTTNRPYAPARTPFQALNVMTAMEGHFDVALLEGFVKFMGPRPKPAPPSGEQ